MGYARTRSLPSGKKTRDLARARTWWGQPCKALDKTLPLFAIKRDKQWSYLPRKRPGLNGGYLDPQTTPHHELPFAKVQSPFCRNPKTHAAVLSPKKSGGFEINGV